jgi:Zn-finger nucleic acid-binding protein
MKCPNCKEHNLVISERANIEIDYCPECRGIWLDRGELDKILERTRQEEQPKQDFSHGPKQEYYSKEQQYKSYKRRKSFLEEIFD